MVYSNSLYPAKPAFKTNKESINAGDYIKNKTASTKSCNLRCPEKLIATNYDKLYASRVFTRIQQKKCNPSFNNTDLNINLFTKMNLTNVCVLNELSNQQCVSSINPNSTFFLNYEIDPNGALFGNTECGMNNFENWLVPYPPSLANL